MTHKIDRAKPSDLYSLSGWSLNGDGGTAGGSMMGCGWGIASPVGAGEDETGPWLEKEGRVPGKSMEVAGDFRGRQTVSPAVESFARGRSQRLNILVHFQVISTCWLRCTGSGQGESAGCLSAIPGVLLSRGLEGLLEPAGLRSPSHPGRQCRLPVLLRPAPRH